MVSAARRELGQSCPMSERAARLRKFHRWVEERDSVFSRAEALDRGLTKYDIACGLSDGRWARYLGGYLLSGAPGSAKATVRAALMRSGPRAIATATSALGIHGFNLNLAAGVKVGDDVAYLSVTANRHVELGPRVVLIRETDVVTSATWIDGIPLVDRDRAIVDALRFLPADEARALLHRCLQLRWITPAGLDHWAQRLRGKAGIRNLRAHHLDSIAGSHSQAEALCVRIFRHAKLHGWEANAAVYDAQGLIGYADFLFRGARVVVEIDGREWHVDRERFQSDRTRQNRLINADWRVLRFTWDDLVNRPDAVIAAVNRAIR